jgi:hypothetical protein
MEAQGQSWQRDYETPISKITRAKWPGGVAQAVEQLLCKCKCEALSSNPSPTKKKKEKDIPLHSLHGVSKLEDIYIFHTYP